MVGGWFGVAQTIGIVAGSGLAAATGGLVAGYLACIAFLIVAGIPFLLLHKDSVLDPALRPAFALPAFLRGFWIDPRRFPDFGWAWLTRFLINLGNSLPQVLAPAIAAPVVTHLGGYPVLYVISAVLGTVGAVLVYRIRA